MNFKEFYKSINQRSPLVKKIAGIICIILGVIALVTPITPGSWLIFVGLELLGFRLALWEKIKNKIL